MTRPRPDVAERFRRVVAGALEKADREHAAHLAWLAGPGRPRRRRAKARAAPGLTFGAPTRGRRR